MADAMALATSAMMDKSVKKASMSAPKVRKTFL